MANDTAKGLVGEREWTITIQNQVHRDRRTSKMCLWQTLSMPRPTLPLKHSWPISNFSAPAFLCRRLPLTIRSHWPEQTSVQMKAPLWASDHRNWGVETSAPCLMVQNSRCVFYTISRSQQSELPLPSSPLPPSGFKSPKTTCTQSFTQGGFWRNTI